MLFHRPDGQSLQGRTPTPEFGRSPSGFVAHDRVGVDRSAAGNLRAATLESAVRISSCTPSAKKALSLSSLKFSKGSTAILFSGTKGTTSDPDDVDTLISCGVSRSDRLQIPKPIAARTATTRAATKARLPLRLESEDPIVRGNCPRISGASCGGGSGVLISFA